MIAVIPELLSAELEAEFATAPDDIKYLIRKYYPLVWNKPTKHLETGFVLTLHGLLEHARAEEKLEGKVARASEVEARAEGRIKRERNTQRSAEWVEWHRQCAERKAWIETKNAEWRARVSARNKALREWDEHVEAARAEYQAAKLTQVPLQPVG